MKRFLLTMLPCMLLLSGCGIIDYFYLPASDDTAQELFELASDSMADKDYYAAAEYFQTLVDTYPFSPYATQAELGLGDAYFLNEDWAQAAYAYQDFEALHPRHEEIPYVLYQIGLSGYRSFKSVDRPQNTLRESLQYLYQLKERYPDSRYAEEADGYIVKIRTLLAKHELFVADFYWNRGSWQSAWRRYEYVAHNFEDLPEVLEYAQRMSELAYFNYQKNSTELSYDYRDGTFGDLFDWL